MNTTKNRAVTVVGVLSAISGEHSSKVRGICEYCDCFLSAMSSMLRGLGALDCSKFASNSKQFFETGVCEGLMSKLG
jgi:hypothetical protein